IPPEQKWHQADQPSGQEKEKLLGAGCAALRGRGKGSFGFHHLPPAACETGAVVVPCGRSRTDSVTATIIPPRPHPSRDPAPDNAKLRTAPEAASGAEFRRRSIHPWHEAHSERGCSARRCQ